jgi:hypothetical protein
MLSYYRHLGGEFVSRLEVLGGVSARVEDVACGFAGVARARFGDCDLDERGRLGEDAAESGD